MSGTSYPNPMVPYLCGFLHHCVSDEGRKLMKVLNVQPHMPDALEITFASGLRLRVTVTVVEEANAVHKTDS